MGHFVHGKQQVEASCEPPNTPRNTMNLRVRRQGQQLALPPVQDD